MAAPVARRRVLLALRHDARFVLHGFYSTTEQASQSPDQGLPPPALKEKEEDDDDDGGETRGRRRPSRSSPTHETICYMMAKRPWTTRLQNSIRSLCSSFDENLVLAVLRGAREPDHALCFFRWVEKTGFRHSVATYGDMVRLLARNRMLNHARCLVLDDMPKRRLPPDEPILCVLIEAYGRAGIPQEVVKIFSRMPDHGVQRTVRSYNVFFKAILRSGRAMMAKRYFNQMLRDGVDPNVFTFNTLIWGFSLCQRMSTASRFFSTMKDRGIAPDVVTCNTLLGGWIRGGKLEEARKMFDEMPRSSLAPNSITYSLMIKGCVEANDMEEALKLYGEMADKGIQPTEQTYAALLPGLCGEAGSRLEDARKLLAEMGERQIALRDLSVSLKLVSGLCNAGLLDEALQTARTMEKALNLSHYSILVESLCREGRFSQAVEVADAIMEKGLLLDPRRSNGSSFSTYESLIQFMCDNGMTGKADALFRQLMKKGAEDASCFGALIRGHSHENSTELAVGILSIATRRGIALDGDCYAALAESFLRRGEATEAKAILDGMMEQGLLPDAHLFRSVMEALMQEGRVQTASRLMRSLLERGAHGGWNDFRSMAQEIVEALAMRGHVEEAIGRIELLRMNGCPPDVDKLLQVLCEKGKMLPAAKLAELGLERDWETEASTFDRVLDALRGEGKTMKAYSLLCKLKKKGGVVDEKGCQALIKGLVDNGKAAEADALYRLVFGHKKHTLNVSSASSTAALSV